MSNLNCYYPLKWTIDKGSYDQDIRDAQATNIGILSKIYYWELKIIGGGGSRKFQPETEKNGFFSIEVAPKWLELKCDTSLESSAQAQLKYTKKK